MPYTLNYTTEPAGLVATFTGEVTGKEIIDHLEQIEDRTDIVYRVGDMRATTNIKASLSELHSIAILECSASKDSKLRKLALVGDKFKHRWLIDTYFAFIETWIGKKRNYETKVFENIKDAYEWLEVIQPVE